jgi:hypothetical protein
MYIGVSSPQQLWKTCGKYFLIEENSKAHRFCTSFHNRVISNAVEMWKILLQTTVIK